jgi:hypothetical protein
MQAAKSKVARQLTADNRQEGVAGAVVRPRDLAAKLVHSSGTEKTFNVWEKGPAGELDGTPVRVRKAGNHWIAE